MTHRVALALVLAALAVAGCGQADGEPAPENAEGVPTVSAYPPVTVGADGIAKARAQDQAEAKELCTSAQQSWPAEWGDHPYVTFDVEPEPFSCVKPAG